VRRVQASVFSIHLEQSVLLLRYPNKLFLPKFFLLASSCLRGFLLLGCCAAEGFLAERVWKPATVAAQGNGRYFQIHPVCFIDMEEEAWRGCAHPQPYRGVWPTRALSLITKPQKEPQS
jgi:hypothetical protein